MTELEQIVQDIILKIYQLELKVSLTYTDYKFGDYATNVAFLLAPRLKQAPVAIAQVLTDELNQCKPNTLSSITNMAGFINFRLSDELLIDSLNFEQFQTLQGTNIVVEFSDPNPFKALHVGHLYTSIIGDSIARLLEYSGAQIHRVNFGGDVGLHVAKNIWAVLQDIGSRDPKQFLDQIDVDQQATFLKDHYRVGHQAYSTNAEAQAEIKALNQKLYEISQSINQFDNLSVVYFMLREWSYRYFDQFYDRLQIKFDKYYPESSVSQKGLDLVRAHTPGVYKESEGAVIYDGSLEKINTYVFITNQGLPTYSAKDVGLIHQKWDDYHFDKSIILTANDQADYMKTVLKSVSKFNPKLSDRTIHLLHGLVKLESGVKMSSRLGNGIDAEEVIETTKELALNFDPELKDEIIIGALKYSFLKQRYGSDIIYNPQEAISMHGQSGPYLQYAYVRTNNILHKAKSNPDFTLEKVNKLEENERMFVFELTKFSSIIEKSVQEYSPHYLANYLYELSQAFSRFYENNRVLNDPRQDIRLFILKSYLKILKKGLELLGIDVVSKM